METTETKSVLQTPKPNKPKQLKTEKHICGALHDLVPCAQFKKREKHPWRSVTFSKVAG